MSILHGNDARVYLDGYDISAVMNKISPKSEVDLHKHAVMDSSGGYHHYRGLAKDEVSFEALGDDGDLKTVLDALWAAAPGAQLMIAYKSLAGKPGYAADEVKIKTQDWSAVSTDLNKIKANFVTEDIPFDECLILMAKATQVAGGNGASLDNAAESTNGLTAYMQVFEITGGGTLTVSLEHSVNGSTGWDPLAVAFAAATGRTTERILNTGTIRRYLRASWTLTAGTATFAIMVKRT
ncbi:MAG: hypothetical protein Q8O55_11420 [Dehalococcoidales bacterium]|nr:hypothetical protein [Dehalococcoidales bacterium]